MTTIQYRVKENPDLARRQGWNKNYRQVEFFVAGSWRHLLWLSLSSLSGTLWKNEAARIIRSNTRLPADAPINFELVS
jgi:hypothetical protein